MKRVDVITVGSIKYSSIRADYRTDSNLLGQFWLMSDLQSQVFSRASGLPFADGGPTMTSSAPIYSRLLKLAAITFLATSAFSQAQPKYDPATEGKFKGTVEELKFVLRLRSIA
jgi:hypothetical protein